MVPLRERYMLQGRRLCGLEDESQWRKWRKKGGGMGHTKGKSRED
jgi:hypothetical protein